MTSLFISYSRKDIEFARKLTESLAGQDLDFWIDWEGIPPSVDWWKEIEKGIEEADIFLFLISPDSVASKVCVQEIDHAVQNGKRLIPIIVRDIKLEDSPAELNHLNWIFFRENDDFKESFGKLTDAIKTDYEWVQIHRRLQVRALEWDRANKDNSFLLRGSDLQEAEAQLVANGGKDPKATALQTEYVLKSRQTTDRQRRITTGIATVGVIVLSILAVFGFVQANRATDNAIEAQNQAATAQAASTLAVANEGIANANAEEAQLQAQRSRAGELAAFAREHRNLELDLAFLLSVEAYNTADTLRSHQALFESSTDVPQLMRFMHGHDSVVESIAWSRDGRLASGSADTTVLVWDTKSGQPTITLMGHEGNVESVAWSLDGILASGSSDQTIIIWDLETGQLGETLKGHSGVVNSVAWSYHGQLASGSADGSVIVWNLDTGQPALTLEGHNNEVWSVAWSPDGKLASSSCGGFDSLICSSGEIIIWNLETGEPMQTLEHNWEITKLSWSPEEELASNSDDNTVIVWDLENGKPSQILEGHSDWASDVAWSPDGRLASSSCARQDSIQSCTKGEIIVWDLRRSRPSQTLEGHTDWILDLAWSTDGRLASSGCGEFDDSSRCISGEIIAWEPESNSAAQAQRLRGGPSGWVTSVAWSQEERLVSSHCIQRDSSYRCIDGQLIVWNIHNSQPAQTLQGHKGEIINPVWSPDGRLASGTWDGSVVLWDLTNGQPDQYLLGHSDIVTSLAWSSDNRLASSSCRERDCVSGQIIVWDLEKGQPSQIMDTPQFVTEVAWSPDGRLATSSCGEIGAQRTCTKGEIILWNLQSGQPSQKLTGHSDRVSSLAWSSDGKLASGSSDGTIIVWDLENSHPAITLQQNEARVNNLSWSPNGKRLASGSLAKMVIVWDLASSQPALIQEPWDLVTSVSWSPAGRLAYVSGSVWLWNVNPNFWVDQICDRAGRNLTQAEWSQYFPGERYRITCSQWPSEE